MGAPRVGAKPPSSFVRATITVQPALRGFSRNPIEKVRGGIVEPVRIVDDEHERLLDNPVDHHDDEVGQAIAPVLRIDRVDFAVLGRSTSVTSPRSGAYADMSGATSTSSCVKLDPSGDSTPKSPRIVSRSARYGVAVV